MQVPYEKIVLTMGRIILKTTLIHLMFKFFIELKFDPLILDENYFIGEEIVL